MEAWRRWQNWVTLAVAVLLVIAAFVFAGARTEAMNSVMVLAIILVATSLVALARPESMADRWVAIVVGALLVVAPWVMAYTDLTGLAWSSWIGGAVTVVIEAMALPQLRRTGGAQIQG